MKLQIVAVGMLDVATFGRDTFFVQTSESTVDRYEARRDGTVTRLNPEPLPLSQVSAAIEKFNDSYRVNPPLPIESPQELTSLLGQFEPTSATSCRYTRTRPAGSR